MGRPLAFRSLRVATLSDGGRKPRAVSDGTTLLFGLPGVRVERVERSADGTRVVHVVTADETAAVCPSCGVVSTSVKGRVSTWPRDIPYGQDRIMVRWTKTRWRCREDYCERSSFTKAIAQVPSRTRTTTRLRTQIGAAIGDAARSVAEGACQDNCVSSCGRFGLVGSL
ncbi:transposase family protein [Mycolicibacterium vanbaalenii]|uniref:transposase family protein n=1 Tax=Mycolicibacterium vanbaalenii TaxID=110539 RepID=UPI001F3DCC3D|nr:transposase family protein [Mycolicibacterium vanbaalenii]WND58338.1 transposase family protein [Mycolicibacterium vanbaalenii]